MGIWVWCEIVCSNCSATTAGQHVRHIIPRSQMKKTAKAEGWSFNKDGEALCSDICRTQWDQDVTEIVLGDRQ